MSTLNEQFQSFLSSNANPYGATGPLGNLSGYNQSGGFYSGGYDVPPGYNQIPLTDQAVRTVSTPTGPIRYYRDLVDPGGGLTGPEQARLFGMSDAMKTDAANIFNYGQTMEGIQNFEDAVITGAQDIRDAGERAQGQFFGFAEDLQGAGQDVLDMVKGRVEESEQNFTNDTAALMSLAQKGESARLRSEIQKLDAAADGGDPIAQQTQMNLRAESAERTSANVIKIGAEYNRGAASLATQNTQSLIAAANTKQGYDSMAANMNQMGIAAMQSATAQAANFEVQGLGQVAQMIASNPYNPVAFLPTLMAQFQFDQTPGSSSFTGFASELL